MQDKGTFVVNVPNHGEFLVYGNSREGLMAQLKASRIEFTLCEQTFVHTLGTLKAMVKT